MKPSASRLGWLGPAIAIVGVAVGGLGVWYMVSAKPRAGEVIDTIAIDAGSRFVIRSEDGGDRSFVELDVDTPDGEQTRWQAFIPHYAGGPGRRGIAWNQSMMSVRVERDGREEVWGLGMDDSAKGGDLRLATEHEPIAAQLSLAAPDAPGVPLTLSDHVRSYELVGGDGWRQLVALDLAAGKGLWRVDLGSAPITRAELASDGSGATDVLIWQAGIRRRVGSGGIISSDAR